MSITNTQYIVTGAAGFIGSAVVWGLNRRGIDDVLIVDHLGESENGKTSARSATPTTWRRTTSSASSPRTACPPM